MSLKLSLQNFGHFVEASIFACQLPWWPWFIASLWQPTSSSERCLISPPCGAARVWRDMMPSYYSFWHQPWCRDMKCHTQLLLLAKWQMGNKSFELNVCMVLPIKYACSFPVILSFHIVTYSEYVRNICPYPSGLLHWSVISLSLPGSHEVTQNDIGEID